MFKLTKEQKVNLKRFFTLSEADKREIKGMLIGIVYGAILMNYILAPEAFTFWKEKPKCYADVCFAETSSNYKISQEFTK